VLFPEELPFKREPSPNEDNCQINKRGVQKGYEDLDHVLPLNERDNGDSPIKCNGYEYQRIDELGNDRRGRVSQPEMPLPGGLSPDMKGPYVVILARKVSDEACNDNSGCTPQNAGEGLLSAPNWSRIPQKGEADEQKCDEQGNKTAKDDATSSFPPPNLTDHIGCDKGDAICQYPGGDEEAEYRNDLTRQNR